MSRFHFESANAEAVSAELVRLRNVVAVSNKNIREVKNCLTASKGFGIEEVREQIERQFAAGAVICDRLTSGKDVIINVNELVNKYSNLARYGFYDLEDPFANIDTGYSSWTGKYKDDPDVVVAGYIDPAIDIISFNWIGDSDEYVGFENGLNAILGKLGQDNESIYQEIYDMLIKGTFGEVSMIKKIFPCLSDITNTKGFLEKIGVASDVADFSNEVIASIATNYFAVQEYLDIMAETYSGNKNMLDIIEKYRETYENHLDSVISSCQEWVIKYGLKNVTKETLKIMSKQFGFPATELQLVGLSFDIASKAFSIDDIHSAAMELRAIEEIRLQTQTAYNESFAKLQSGIFTESDVLKTKNLFDIYKNTMITEYETMIAIEKAKYDSDVTWLNGAAWNESYRDKCFEQYNSAVNEYMANIDELNKISNPIS